jgi:hypothetical protein
MLWTPDLSVIVTAEMRAEEARRIRIAAVDVERDRRIAGGFIFNGTLYQARPADQLNIAGAAAGASIAITNGALPDDLRWQNPEVDFVWIAADNSMVPMDAQTVVAFGQAAMGHVSAHMWTARAIKDRIAAGETIDIGSDAVWP